MPATETSEEIVRLSGFGKQYRRHVAVTGVDLTLRRGEIYGLIGPDGAGKSTLMKAIAGVLAFEEGHLEVFGVSVDSERAAERVKPRLGFLPQGLGQNLYPDLSVEENVDFFARIRLVPEHALAERKHRLLAMTRLDPFRDRSMKHLSGGMKQKLGLVCTLIHEPDLVILDEPTTGVDPVSRRDFWVILSELVQERGITALVSTAYMDEAARFHQLSLLFQGRILAKGTPSEIHDLTPGSVVVLEAEPQVETMRRLQQVFPQVEAEGSMLRVFVDGLDQEPARSRVSDCLVGLEIKNLESEEPGPEDAFVALLRRQGLAQESSDFPLAAIPTFRGEKLAIEANQLVRDFGSFRAVDRVSFQVREGEIFGLLGSNGAGKTTVIKMLTGLLRTGGGEGRVAGVDMRQARGAVKERIGYMSQAFSLYLDLTVVENIRLFAGIYGLGGRETNARLAWILSMAGLAGYESELTGRLPMGVRQRLALGCALVHKPRVLFLDEPTSGVDPIGRRRFWEVLLRLSREEGVGMLVTTHYMGEAEHCDRLALMYAGRIVSEGSPREMKEHVEKEAGSLLEVGSDQPAKAMAHLEMAGLPRAVLFGTDLHLFSKNTVGDEATIRRVLESEGINVQSVKRRPLSLEDVFVYRVMGLEQQGSA